MRKSRRLPNFRNLSIHLRLLVLHLLLLTGLTFSFTVIGQEGSATLEVLSALAFAWVPPLLLILGGLYGAYPWLRHLSYRSGMMVILTGVLGVTSLVMLVYQHWVLRATIAHGSLVLLLSLVDTLVCFYYLDLLQRAYSPAISEARLQALQARIRPHFLFNSLNAVLSLIRSQPQQAETALEDMAELFRVLMAENNALVPLAQEIALCEQYLNIEKLRLGERLQCVWRLPAVIPKVMIPPLLLQPLIENAVYHGIEPRMQGGTIEVDIFERDNMVWLRILNPLPVATLSAAGNQMAVNNIRERLRLHYDLEAHFSQTMITPAPGQRCYEVNLRFPSGTPLP